jgi:NAD(P)-dependent dehydrogenase (short-subunit alcohol dehydrogenase family)
LRYSISVLQTFVFNNTKAFLSKEQLENFVSSIKATVPLQCSGKSNEVADAAFFLATCGYVTGQIIEVDGGWTAS